MTKTHGFRCPTCGGETSVARTTSGPKMLVRRRVCKKTDCGHTFTTREIPTGEPITPERRIGAHTARILLTDLIEQFGLTDMLASPAGASHGQLHAGEPQK